MKELCSRANAFIFHSTKYRVYNKILLWRCTDTHRIQNNNLGILEQPLAKIFQRGQAFQKLGFVLRTKSTLHVLRDFWHTWLWALLKICLWRWILSTWKNYPWALRKIWLHFRQMPVLWSLALWYTKASHCYLMNCLLTGIYYFLDDLKKIRE